MTEFIRENRYIVLKETDLRCLPKEYRKQLDVIVGMANTSRWCDNKSAITYLVVESDWPEFEPTWKAIEDRVLKEYL